MLLFLVVPKPKPGCSSFQGPTLVQINDRQDHRGGSERMLLLFYVSKVELRLEVRVGVMVKPPTDPNTPLIERKLTRFCLKVLPDQ